MKKGKFSSQQCVFRLSFLSSIIIPHFYNRQITLIISILHSCVQEGSIVKFNTNLLLKPKPKPSSCGFTPEKFSSMNSTNPQRTAHHHHSHLKNRNKTLPTSFTHSLLNSVAPFPRMGFLQPNFKAIFSHGNSHLVRQQQGRQHGLSRRW